MEKGGLLVASKWIKNTSGSTSTYLGQQITNNSYYQIQGIEQQAWINNSALLTDIGTGDAVVAKDDSGNNDIVDVSTAINYLKDTVALADSDGAPLIRTKITNSGWHFQLQAVEFTTAKLNAIYNADESESDLGFTTVKFYDDQDAEITSPTQQDLDNDCVKTVVEWEADHDIEVIGGIFEQPNNPTTDIRLWIIAIPDLTIAQGGSIPFIHGGINLKLLSGPLDIDGKTPKLMPYSATYHTNKFRLVFKHGAGVQHQSMVVFKLFRLNV